MTPLTVMRRKAHESASRMAGQLGELVSCESPTDSHPHLAACADLLAGWGEAVLGRSAQRAVVDGTPHLLWSAPDQRVLLLGHFDTVWPAGTTRDWPFAVAGNMATGPGVCDMKAGIVQLLSALRMPADTSRVGVLLTGDEEGGSPTSRALIEREAQRCGSVLVCEPSTSDGHLKVARKGSPGRCWSGLGRRPGTSACQRRRVCARRAGRTATSPPRSGCRPSTGWARWVETHTLAVNMLR